VLVLYSPQSGVSKYGYRVRPEADRVKKLTQKDYFFFLSFFKNEMGLLMRFVIGLFTF